MARSPLLRRLQTLLRVAMAKGKRRMGREELAAYEFSLAVNRRRFAEVSGKGIVGLSACGLLAACRTPTETGSAVLGAEASKAQDQGKVVVVGAGTGGLTAAYRLFKAGIASTVYEGSDRTGGRMFTQANFNGDGMFCERGGELVDTQHTDLISLCGELGLGIQELRNDPAGATRELFYSHGQWRSEEQIVLAFQPFVTTLARDLLPLTVDGSVTVPTYNSALAQVAAVQAFDRMTLPEYFASVGGDPWLIDLLAVAYVGEYGLEADNQSALNFMLEVGATTDSGFKMLGSSDESKRIAGGNESLPKALVGAMKGGVSVKLGHMLTAVIDRGTKLCLVFQVGLRTVEVEADQVVLALPVALLREVDLTGVELTAVKRRAIKEWGVGTNAKLMSGFKSRPWRTAANPGGIVVYTDTQSQELWETSRGQDGASGIITSFLGGEAGRAVGPGAYGATLTVLDKLFPGTKAAADGNKLLQHWPSWPFTKGSYTCQKPGQYTTLSGALGEPELGGRLVLAGEHCSRDYSGFMNGAVQSGNNAAQLILTKLGVASAAGGQPG